MKEMNKQNPENPKPISVNEAKKNTNQYTKLKYAKLGFHYLISNFIYFLFIPFLAHIFTNYSIENLFELYTKLRLNYKTSVLYSPFIIFFISLYLKNKPKKVYLIDFSCYKPDPSYKFTREDFLKISSSYELVTKESLEFQKKIMEKSGISDIVYGPKHLKYFPHDESINVKKNETEMVIFGAIDELLLKTGIDPKEIGIVIVNSSLFNPCPSLSAVIVNRYKLRDNVLSYSLAGMGCSAGLISIDLANQLLQVHPDSYVLVVSTENINGNFYKGNQRSRLLANCLFRVGGAAILLSNRSSDRRRSKYELKHVVRTHKGANDTCYNCVIQQEDEQNQIGVSLSKDLMSVAGEALKTNITTLGPLVLPISEQLLFFATLIVKKVFKMKIKQYVPDFKLAFEHFCIHAGGKSVIAEVEKSLELMPWHMEPTRMTLYRFGNTSSSSLWYELAYSEAKGRIKKGHRIWQIGFGSGFKCNSTVWQALKNIDPRKEILNPWMDEIHEFPAQMPVISPIVSNLC